MRLVPRHNIKLGPKPIHPVRAVMWTIVVGVMTCVMGMLGVWAVVRLLGN